MGVVEVAADGPYAIEVFCAALVEAVLVLQQDEFLSLEVLRRVLVEVSGNASADVVEPIA